jgi:hypothetical protein
LRAAADIPRDRRRHNVPQAGRGALSLIQIKVWTMMIG